jgi:hypothetical protein
MSQQRKLYLEWVNEYHEKGRISNGVLKSFYEKLPSLEKAAIAVEDASGLSYPIIVFDPSLTLINYPSSTFSETVIYASTQIRKLNGTYQLCVVISLPFLLYAKESTLMACIAHELLHYVFITIALSNKAFAVLSGERLDSPEVHMAFDDTHIVAPEEWLNSKELVDLIKATFNPIVVDKELEAEIKSNWIDKSLPVRQMSGEESKTSIPIIEVAKIPLDIYILQKNKLKDNGRS